MTPEQERVEIRKALESKEAKYLCGCAFANAPTWLRNSLDREEQLIAERDAYRQALEKYADMIIVDSEDHPQDVGMVAREVLSKS